MYFLDGRFSIVLIKLYASLFVLNSFFESTCSFQLLLLFPTEREPHDTR